MSPATETAADKRRTRKIASDAAEKALKTLSEEETPRDTELEVEFGAPGEGEEIRAGDPTDIFEAAKLIIDRHDFAKFTIKKNGEYVATKPFPYSIEQLQKEYGAGSYLIFLKEGSTGHIKKQQTIQIADAPGGKKSDVEFAFGGQGQPGFEQPKQPSFMELFLLKSDMEEKNRIRQQELEAKIDARQKELEAKLKETERTKESSSTEMMKFMMTMQQESSKQLQAIMMESNKTQMTLMTTLLSKAGEKKDDGLKAHELAKMLGDAEKNGYSRWKDIAEMIDRKAESRAEEIASQQGDGDESLTKTLVKGFIPIISQAMQNQGQLPQAPQYTPQQIEQARIAENNRRIQIENQRLAQQREKKIRAEQARNQNTAQGTGTAQTVVVPPAPKNPVVHDGLGLPKAAETAAPSPRESMNGHFKEHIQTLVIPLIAEDLTAGLAPDVSVEKCLRVLEEKRITLKDVLDNFKLDDIMGIVTQYDLPKEVKPWFEGFYANLENKARVATRVAPENHVGGTP